MSADPTTRPHLPPWVLCGLGACLSLTLACQEKDPDGQPKNGAEIEQDTTTLQLPLFSCETNQNNNCQTHDDCCDDRQCRSGVCVPIEGDTPPVECVDNTGFTWDPTVYCEWDPAGGDNNVYTTPLVIELVDEGGVPSRELVFTTWEIGGGFRIGTMRVVSTHDPVPGQGGAPAQCRLLDSVGRESVPSHPGLQLRPAYGAQLAAGDLNQDGRPDVVGLFTAHGQPTLPTEGRQDAPTFLSALDFQSVNGAMTHHRLWVGRVCDGDPATLDALVSAGQNRTNAGPSMYDITGDGRPEILWERHVFNAEGCLLSGVQGCQLRPLSGGMQYWECPLQIPNPLPGNDLGVFNLVEDLGLDYGLGLNLVTANAVFRFDVQPGQVLLTPHPDWNPPTPLPPGMVAIADMTAYAGSAVALQDLNGLLPPNNPPELVTLSTPGTGQGTLRIVTNQGAVLWQQDLVRCPNPTARNWGGPITIADFDGDGFPEIGVAGACHYAVYDPDCGGTTPEFALLAQDFRRSVNPALRGQCVRQTDGYNGENYNPAYGPGVLWARPVQDESSNATGSTVFDFDGDGRSEVIYRDECRLWVFDGLTGNPREDAQGFDYVASSYTGYEGPPVADVVSEPPAGAPTGYAGPTAAEIVIPRGRWLTNAVANRCAASLAPLPFVRKGGVSVVQQRDHHWSPTLPQWSQHAYSATHYRDGKVLSRADGSWVRNYRSAGLNSYRANPVLAFSGRGKPDLTAQLTGGAAALFCPESLTEFTGLVCNRGAVAADLDANGGVPVLFQARLLTNTPAGQWDLVSCGDVSGPGYSLRLSGQLAPGQCVPVRCDHNLGYNPAGGLRMVVDPPYAPQNTGSVEECFEYNNISTSPCNFNGQGIDPPEPPPTVCGGPQQPCCDVSTSSTPYCGVGLYCVNLRCEEHQCDSTYDCPAGQSCAVNSDGLRMCSTSPCLLNGQPQAQGAITCGLNGLTLRASQCTSQGWSALSCQQSVAHCPGACDGSPQGLMTSCDADNAGVISIIAQACDASCQLVDAPQSAYTECSGYLCQSSAGGAACTSSCAIDSDCATGHECVAGACVRVGCDDGSCLGCGALGQSCCGEVPACGDGLVCGDDQTCRLCMGAECPMQPCGQVGQACCAGGTCDGDAQCNAEDLCTMVVVDPICGDLNEPCCAGAMCSGQLVCMGGLCASPSPLPVPGACGAAAGQSALQAPTNNLCAQGTASAVSGSGPFVWTCAGSAGGADASCSADRSCAGAAQSWTVSGATCNASLGEGAHGMSAMAVDGMAPTTGQRTYLCQQGTWTAQGAGACAQAPSPEAGVCGAAAGQSTLQAPTNNLCSKGMASAVSGSGPFTWTCSGVAGGASVMCSSNRSCAAGAVTWSIQTAQQPLTSCSGVAMQTSHGAVASGIEDNTAPTVGRKDYQCNQGQWVHTAQAGVCVDLSRECPTLVGGGGVFSERQSPQRGSDGHWYCVYESNQVAQGIGDCDEDSVSIRSLTGPFYGCDSFEADGPTCGSPSGNCNGDCGVNGCRLP